MMGKFLLAAPGPAEKGPGGLLCCEVAAGAAVEATDDTSA